MPREPMTWQAAVLTKRQPEPCREARSTPPHREVGAPLVAVNAEAQASAVRRWRLVEHHEVGVGRRDERRVERLQLEGFGANSSDSLQLRATERSDLLGIKPETGLEHLPRAAAFWRESHKARFGHTVGGLVDERDGDLERVVVDGLEAEVDLRGRAERAVRFTVNTANAVLELRLMGLRARS